jgi:hypothetical protein
MRNSLLKLYQNQVFIYLCYLLIAFLLYFRILNNFFVSDDFHWLSLARSRSWDWSIFFTNYEGLKVGGSYNPFIFVLWKIFSAIFGLHYQWYHVVSIFLHANNACLVYILAKKLLNKQQKSAYWASIAGLFFLLWPVQVEAVSWIAAWPHLWATLFYLASLIFYIKFLEVKKNTSLILALIFFILAIFTKEIAMTLPVALFFIAWQLDYKIPWKKIWPFFLILVIFLALRWQATAQLFGYYGQASLAFKLPEYFGNLAIMFLDWPSAGYFRTIFYKIWYRYLWALDISFLIGLGAYLLYLLKFKKNERLYLFGVLILSCLPVVPLGLHRTTFAGERYLYLPTVFFAIWFVALLADLKLVINKKILVILFMAVCFLILIVDKTIIWSKAAKLSEQIVTSYATLQLAPDSQVISVALPDNLQGAEIFRNNLQQALELYYPVSHPQILSLPIYVQLKNFDTNYNLLRWRADEKGWFLDSVDRSFVVTGLTSITVNQVYFELWHYNYQNYTADMVRLIPEADLLGELKQGNIRWLTFDRGRLQIR